MTKVKRIIITVFALIGLALSIELCVVYYNANFAIDAAPSICAISDKMDCDGVAKTSYSQFFGVPLSLWGVLLYLFFLFMTYVDKLQNIKGFGLLKVFKNPTSYIFCIGIFSFAVSMVLGSISVFKIDSICIFCFMTYFVNLLIAIAAKNKGISIFDEIKTSFSDFLSALKEPRNVFWFVLVLLLFLSCLVYTSVSNIFAPQIAKKNELEQYFKLYDSQVDKNIMGPKDANVVINEYMDFNCGGCFFSQLYLHRIVSEFENVKVVQRIIPLEKECNHNMKFDGHKTSCIKAKYALAAAKQNKYWQMADVLFNEAPESEKEIIEEARLLDLDIKKLKEDANSEQVKNEIQEMIKYADSQAITGTPTFVIGVNKKIGIDSYGEFKKYIIEQGGKEKLNHD